MSSAGGREHRTTEIDEALAFLGERLVPERPLGPLTTYRVGGPAERFVEVADADELVAVAAAFAPLADRFPVLVIGRGSNLLVADRGLRGLVLQLGESFTEISVGAGPDGGDRPVPAGTVRVVAGGAASLPVVARRTVAAGLTGFEWAVGVPGSVGGAVRMNAGGHGSDMAAAVVGVRVVDLGTGEDVRMDSTSLGFGYRRSAIRSTQVVVSAEVDLVLGDPGPGAEELSEIVRWRREHQPGGQNAGSVFTNPPGDSAGRLVEAAGCKGLRRGTAEVSRKHANFIQADPGGSADDIRALMDEVVERVRAHSGVTLHPETVMVGFGDDEGEQR
jgi:UDP-N-acetylmuramate dehydrogenase